MSVKFLTPSLDPEVIRLPCGSSKRCHRRFRGFTVTQILFQKDQSLKENKYFVLKGCNTLTSVHPRVHFNCTLTAQTSLSL